MPRANTYKPIVEMLSNTINPSPEKHTAKLKLQQFTFTGSETTLKLAQIDAAKSAIDYYTKILNTHISNDYTRQFAQEHLVWSVTYQKALLDGIAITYQFPVEIRYWRIFLNKYGWLYLFDTERLSGHHPWWPISTNIPRFPFVGFGRSPEEAKRNAYKNLLTQYTLRLRNAGKSNHLISELKECIDSLNEELAEMSAELDIFQQVKGIRDPQTAWSDAPKPAESEPIDTKTA